MLPEHAVTIIVSIIGLFGILLTAGSGILVAMLRRQHIKIDNINDSVNHRHLKVPEDHPLTVKNGGTPGIMDLLLDSHDRLVRIEVYMDQVREWRKSYENLPWATGPGAKEWLAAFDSWQKHIEEKIAQEEAHDDDRHQG